MVQKKVNFIVRRKMLLAILNKFYGDFYVFEGVDPNLLSSSVVKDLFDFRRNEDFLVD